jgi:Holliday junction resolvase RusA-like endonuclease
VLDVFKNRKISKRVRYQYEYRNKQNPKIKREEGGYKHEKSQNYGAYRKAVSLIDAQEFVSKMIKSAHIISISVREYRRW